MVSVISNIAPFLGGVGLLLQMGQSFVPPHLPLHRTRMHRAGGIFFTILWLAQVGHSGF